MKGKKRQKISPKAHIAAENIDIFNQNDRLAMWLTLMLCVALPGSEHPMLYLTREPSVTRGSDFPT